MRGLIVIFVILLLFASSKRAKRSVGVLERCQFPIAGETEWWTEDGGIKPSVEADLVPTMDATIPSRTTWTPQSLVEVVMKQYKPKCSFAAVDRVVEDYKDRMPPEAYNTMRMQLDVLYALADQRLQVAAGG